MIEKIAKLLAAAEGASTEEEAQAFFAKAQALATTHAISLAEARASGTRRSRRSPMAQEYVVIGEPRRHVNRHLTELMVGIAHANDVKVDIRPRAAQVVLYGTEADIDVVKLLWSRISTQMVRFAEAYLREGTWRLSGERVTKQSARASYYEGFVGRVSARLSRARREQIHHWHEDGHAADTSDGAARSPEADDGNAVNAERAALVLKQKSEEVDVFYKANSSARGTWNPSRRTRHVPASYRRGVSDGGRASLSDPGEITSPKSVTA